MKHKILQYDPYLKPYEKDFDLRAERLKNKLQELLPQGQSLWDFANGYEYFGLHQTPDGWYYREWAPGAEAMYLTGDFCGWDRHAYPMEKLENGVFSLFIPGKDTLQNGMKVLTVVVHEGQELERIPLYANYVVQEKDSVEWNAVIHTAEAYPWTDEGFKPKSKLYIYECHIGMAQEEGKVGSYREFMENTLPRIKKLGYTAIQIMAIMEHPYYASFGYQVTNFFAPSSRFGTPEELKALIDRAHKLGIAVLLDVVHSHACKNTREGINQFDGTDYQFFHAGGQGEHPAWNTKCFNYDKNEVIHFLLSNLKYWMTQFHFDGFRFDGVTSMLYHDHGLGTAFMGYDQYFSMNTDVEAVTYLQLANLMVRQGNPKAITIAEDTSALPGLALPVKDGGVGFTYRLAMGEPDMWIKLLKEVSDDNWNMDYIYYELSTRRPKEPVIGYCESHDQALVGDKTIMFRMCDSEMYWSMNRDNDSPIIDRAMALHKMIRLVTLSLGGEGYLNFMGNEFGHPEWIDFPREGNGWSYHYCRRQWHLADDKNLKYQYLNRFDKDMIALSKRLRVLGKTDRQLYISNDQKIMAFRKGEGVFLFNFHPTWSQDGLEIPMPEAGTYRMCFTSDDFDYGGHGRVYHQDYETHTRADGTPVLQIYLPCRTAVVLQKV